ncbi:MOSC domain-containing protein [Blastopirellula marina]|uniref:MOSC domain-containing protein n=2 Tax=Pirellulales TaxID=2691354 RepID=A0A2S8F255_9BACT|nr:MOSC domain-containing protein [Blastopirellula marina]RCS44582.1 MOSC domain-containing protein [Bremerella cremea]
MPEHLTLEQLHSGLPHIQQSPRDEGVLKAIVIRPKTDERSQLAYCELSLEGGVHGDNWALGCWKSLPDGSPHPDVQIAITNSRAIDLIAGDSGRWALAGDNLYVDFDLSEENLPAGQQLAIGEVVLEVTEIPHNGCRKFSDRFGGDALKFVNSSVGKELHLRGIYARVVKSGIVRVGDEIRKLTAT